MGLTANQMNTALAKRLKAIFERSREHRYAAFKEASKLKKKKGSSDSAEPEHANSLTLPSGVLAKDDEYAQRGSDYIRSQDGRGVYRNFAHPHLDEVRDQVRKEAEFPGGPAANFTPSATDARGGKAGQRFPYLWEAHHLLPGSAFYYEGANGPCFTFKQMWLLLQTNHNINHGHNVIMLPSESWAVPVHSLLQHPSDHPEYTQRVMRDLTVIAEQIQQKIDQAKPHKDVCLDLFNDLKNLEERYWKYIVGLSRKVVGAVTSGQTFVDSNVRFATKDGTTKYDYGALI